MLPLLKELKIDASGITFHADDTLDLSDALVTLTDNRGTSPIIDGKKLSEVAKMAEYSVSYDKVTLKTGNNQKVTVALTHKASGETIACDVLINVQKTTYAFVAEIGAPKKTDYTEGEMFDPSGIAWKIKRNGTEELTVTSGFKTYPDRPLTPADTSVTVVYGDVARVYPVNVYPVNVAGRTLVSIAVTTMPQIASFYVGQTFDPTGMVVTATYNNKTTAEVKGYTYDKTAFAESDIGTKKITLTYKEGDMTATTTISMPIVAAPIRAMTGGHEPEPRLGFLEHRGRPRGSGRNRNGSRQGRVRDHRDHDRRQQPLCGLLRCGAAEGRSQAARAQVQYDGTACERFHGFDRDDHPGQRHLQQGDVDLQRQRDGLRG